MTEDLDVFIEASGANAEKLRSALVELGFGNAAPNGLDPRAPFAHFVVFTAIAASTASSLGAFGAPRARRRARSETASSPRAFPTSNGSTKSTGSRETIGSNAYVAAYADRAVDALGGKEAKMLRDLRAKLHAP